MAMLTKRIIPSSPITCVFSNILGKETLKNKNNFKKFPETSVGVF